MATHFAPTVFTRLAATLALVGAALSVPAVAAPADQAPSVAVRYGDLDLTTQAGARTLGRRIAIAANNVCPDSDDRDLTASAQARACRASVIARAQPQVETAMAAARDGKALAANTVTVPSHAF